MKTGTENAKVIPAEWAEQKAVIVGFPSHQPLWQGSLLAQAQQEVASLCNYLAETQTCYVLVANAQAQSVAERLITQQASIVRFDFGDIWFRDIAPIFKSPSEAVRFNHNGWGGKYLYPYDDTASERLSSYFNLQAKAFDYVLEGGALDHNGEGAILTTRQCLLNANRNGWSQHQAEERLKESFNATHIFWLDQGLACDHTDGHIDNTARFVATKTVLCQHATGNDDPNALLYARHPFELKEQGLDVVSLPSPGFIKDPDNDMMPASHLNFVVSNEFVIFPNYLKYTFADKKCVAEATETLVELFPTREIISLPSNAILTGGGSFHCISQQVPL